MICQTYYLFLFCLSNNNIWDKVFTNGPRKICERQPLKNLSRPYPNKFFEGCLPQILLGLFLNTLFHLAPFLKSCGNFISSSAFCNR